MLATIVKNEEFLLFPGGTTISLFSKKGLFRQGLLDIQVWSNQRADGRIDGNTPGKLRDKVELRRF